MDCATISREKLEQVVRRVVSRRLGHHAERPGRAGFPPVHTPLVVNISVRHVHISPEHLEILFGPGAELSVGRWLYQEGEFAAEQTVDLVGPKRRMLRDVRILGPERPKTQVELAFSDAILLGVQAPVRMSGNHEGTHGCLVMGPRGHIELPAGVIRAQRHVHMAPADARAHGVETGAVLDLVVEHPTCPAVLGGIVARVDPRYRLEVHIDSDEGNACDLPRATGVRLARWPRECRS